MQDENIFLSIDTYHLLRIHSVDTKPGRWYVISCILRSPSRYHEVTLAHTGLSRIRIWTQICLTPKPLIFPGQYIAFSFQALLHTKCCALNTVEASVGTYRHPAHPLLTPHGAIWSHFLSLSGHKVLEFYF